MNVKQIYELVNGISKEILGDNFTLQEDLKNVVDFGDALFNANAVDNYVHKLIDRIGRVIISDRVYDIEAFKGVIRDGWEFGSVAQKICSTELIEAQENPTWNLTQGASVDPNIFKGIEGVSVKFYNSKTTLEVDISITELQLKESFTDASTMNRFISFIHNEINKSLTVKTEAMIMRAVNALIAETLYVEYPSAQYSASSGVRAVNLLYLYNQKFGTQLTKDKALVTPEFIRFASQQIAIYSTRMKRLSKVFNIGATPKFTPKTMQRLAVLTDFMQASTVYLQADTYHKELVQIPDFAEEVAYWQTTGTAFAFDDISKINVITPNNHAVECNGVLAVLYDYEAVAVCNENSRVKTNYNGRGEFMNEFHKVDCSYLADTNENFVVFFIA